jgi:hypothetical protein
MYLNYGVGEWIHLAQNRSISGLLRIRKRNLKLCIKHSFLSIDRILTSSRRSLLNGVKRVMLGHNTNQREIFYAEMPHIPILTHMISNTRVKWHISMTQTQRESAVNVLRSAAITGRLLQCVPLNTPYQNKCMLAFLSAFKHIRIGDYAFHIFMFVFIVAVNL